MVIPKQSNRSARMKANGGRILLVITVLLVVTLCVTAAGLMKSVTNSKRSPDSCHPLVIAHRGASGYVPEHTLAAYGLAIMMGADYVEPDVVMTKDGHLVARHDNELGLTTDVSQRSEFSDRHRTQNVDGSELTGWFTEDFTLDELKTLRAIERIPQNRPGNARMDRSFDIPTVQEIIDLVKSLEISQRRTIGIYPEIKHSTHFQRLGLAMEAPLVQLLHNNGYEGRDAHIYIQSFEVNNLKELKKITDLRLLQLYSSDKSSQPFDQATLGTNLTYGAMATAEGLKDVASYAYATGPDKSYIIPRDENDNLGTPTTFVADAHAAGLKVHPYTFRAENPFLPAEFRSSEQSDSAIGNFKGEISAFLAAGIDGLFADQPDIPVRMRGPCL
ncbi:glycerophosphodiester phosphodiesterase, periplasmic-like isoform X1 [Cydia pomonella]|uniref:glycerophosphodiester phosphodiesterase, periplasmic-like isoform X1 n=2 Tax=Cydia pomonella TaxID=82600 RepID=UPI002ADD8DF7|nr:glycerophosphodiester phosphodiesterase, periplasmic-like isoform X1 [Cydia pomonella]